MSEYIPYGTQWKKQIMRFKIEDIENIFEITKNKGETKSEFLDRIVLELRKSFRKVKESE